MWDQVKQLVRQSAIYGLGNAAISILSLLLTPLYTHHLSPQEYGGYSLVLIVYSLLAMLVECGLTSSIGRYYFDEAQAADAEAPERYRRRLVSTALVASAVVSAAVSAILYLSAGWVASRVFRAAGYEPLLELIALTLAFRGFTTVPLIWLRVTERPAAYSILTLIQIALFLGFNVLSVAVLELGVMGILYSQLASMVVHALLLVVAITSDLTPAVSWGLLRRLLGFGLPFVPGLLMMWVVDFSDRYLLDLYLSTTLVGIYSLGYRFGQAMMFVVTAFSLAWVPVRFKVLSLDEPQAVYARVATLYLAAAGLAWVTLSVFSPEIIALVSPPEFASAAAFIAPVGFGYLVYGLFVIAVTGLGVTKKTASVPAVVIVAAVLNVALNLGLIPVWGAMAAAYSTIAAYMVMTLGSLVVSQRHYPIPFEYGRCAILLGGMVGLAGAASALSGLPAALGLGLKVILVGLYGLVVLASGTFRPAEGAQLLVWLFRRFPRLRPSCGPAPEKAARK